MAYGLDTDSFLKYFVRMTSRRGYPQETVSDRGTNFVGADRELRELVSGMDTNKIQDQTASKGVKWCFNPPLAPHVAGVHEAMVKAAKKAIRAILSNADINDEELMTTFIGVEALLNSHPLKPWLHERFFACDGDAIFLKLSRRQRAAKIACVATLSQVRDLVAKNSTH